MLEAVDRGLLFAGVAGDEAVAGGARVAGGEGIAGGEGVVGGEEVVEGAGQDELMRVLIWNEFISFGLHCYGGHAELGFSKFPLWQFSRCRPPPSRPPALSYAIPCLLPKQRPSHIPPLLAAQFYRAVHTFQHAHKFSLMLYTHLFNPSSCPIA